MPKHKLVAKRDGNETYYYTKKLRHVGMVYYNPKWKWWGYASVRMENKAGLSGHDGMDTEAQAIEMMLEADRNYK